MWLSRCGRQHNRRVTNFILSDDFRSCPNHSHIPRLCFCRYYGEEEPGKPEAGGEPLLAACLLLARGSFSETPFQPRIISVSCIGTGSCPLLGADFLSLSGGGLWQIWWRMGTKCDRGGQTLYLVMSSCS